MQDAGKVVDMAIGGFGGGIPSQRFWFEVLGMTLSPGHSVTTSVNNGGRELLIRNDGPDVQFDLNVHLGYRTETTLSRTSIVLSGNTLVSLTPGTWESSALASSKIMAKTIDAKSGVVLRTEEF